MIYDTIIIGAGISGMTAAIYAARKRMNFLFISQDFGGQFNISGEVLNYPGIIKTTGIEFSDIMKKQMEFNRIKLTEDAVEKIEKKGGNFRVIAKNGSYETRTVIICTGSKPRKLNVPGEEEFANKGVHYCAICDGPMYANKTVAVIGGGDSALEAVDFLLDIAKRIYLVVKKELTAYEYLQERIRNHKKVTCITNADTTEIYGDKFVKGIKYKKGGKTEELKVDGVFIEIGRIPNTDFVKDFVKLEEHNHILINCWGETSVPGVYAAGDCSSVHEYQYVISAGQGCTALLKAARYLARKK